LFVLALPMAAAAVAAGRAPSLRGARAGTDHAGVGTRPAARTFRVLVTGFEAFPGWEENPSGGIARRLSGTCDDLEAHQASLRVCWSARTLPVDHNGTRWLASILPHLTRPSPDAVVMLGAGKELTVELAARNVEAETGRRIADDGAPLWLDTTVDLAHHGLKASLSRLAKLDRGDAGRYYCNEIYYRTLRQIRRMTSVQSPAGFKVPSMFIHLMSEKDADGVKAIVAQTLWATYVAKPLATRVASEATPGRGATKRRSARAVPSLAAR